MGTEHMNYCMECGTKLKMKPLKGEGEVPYCEHCGTFRFPVFNTACSMIVMNPEKTKILLIKQYGRDDYILVAGYVNKGEGAEGILVAGYVNKGEDAEAAALREIREELGVNAADIRFNRTHYFAPSNTLMINFRILLPSEEIHPNEEIDDWQWFSLAEAREKVRPNSLARDFLEGMLDGEYHFHDDRYGTSRKQ